MQEGAIIGFFLGGGWVIVRAAVEEEHRGLHQENGCEDYIQEKR